MTRPTSPANSSYCGGGLAWLHDDSRAGTASTSVAAPPGRILVDVRRLLTRPVTSAASGTTARHATGRGWQGCHTGHTVAGRQAWQLARGDGQTDSCRTALHRRVEGPGRSKHDATGTDGSWVHIGCIRLSCAVVSSRLTSVNMPRFPATLTTADDWSLLPSFSDKEEVPGSSPGSPTGDFPANRHPSGGRSTRTACSTTRRGCIWGAVATSSLHVDGESSSATFNDRAAAGRPCLTDQKSGWCGDEGQHDAGGSG